MPVTGGKEAAALLRAIPAAVELRVKFALEQAALIVLEDMRALTPRDPANPGPHARDGLTIRMAENGLRADIGLPTAGLASDYFWFRFLDGGTQGGEVTFRRRGGVQLFTMTVPARPALRIRERALEGNLGEVDRLVRAAVAEGLQAAP